MRLVLEAEKAKRDYQGREGLLKGERWGSGHLEVQNRGLQS